MRRPNLRTLVHTRLGLLLFALLSLAACSDDGQYWDRSNTEAVYWHGPRDRMAIALTFDDGPSDFTEELLDVLDKHNVKATFFVVGKYVAQLPEVLRETVRRGHVIGNHTYEHGDLSGESRHYVFREIEKSEETILDATGLRTALFRPPYGKLSTKLVGEVYKRGYTTIRWSNSGKDWSTNSDHAIAIKIIDETRPGAIILLHDGNGESPSSRAHTLRAVRLIVPTLKVFGFEFLTVPELLRINAYKD